MADNVLKATVDAIAQADNELGGVLTTRLTEAHIHGREDGAISSGVGSDILQSPVTTFEASMIGLELDLISVTNRGRYKISAVPVTSPVGLQATLTSLAGAPVTLSDEDPVVWRIGTLRVETTYEFLNPPTTTDLVGQLWVGSEAAVVTYGARTLSPGACSFDQLGDPVTGSGYLTTTQREDAEVIEARRGYSDLDKLWRALLTAYAEGDELDRIGRVTNVARPRGMSDTIYRRLLQVMPYLPRCIVQAFEIVLGALYPSATAGDIQDMIWEDLVDYPCAIFLLLPEVAPGTDPEGRCFFNDEETVTSSSTTAVTVASTPITVESVVPAGVTQELDMAVLPSAESPAWTYVNEGSAEGTVFAVDPLGLEHDISGTANGGRYKRVTPNVDTAFCEIDVWWSPLVLTTVAGYPWHLMIHDGEREICLEWDGSTLILGQLDGTVVAGPVTLAHSTPGTWYHFVLKRRGDYVYGLLNGTVIFDGVPASSFAADSNREVGFGYKNNGSSNTWTTYWDNLGFASASKRNYLNLNRSDGVMSVATDKLNSAAALFIAGDTGKQVRLYGVENKNDGLWLATYSSGTQLTLGPVVRGPEDLSGGAEQGGALVQGAGANATVTVLDPWFRSVDLGKTITISGSALGNNGNVEVLEVVSSYVVRVDKGAGSFATEEHLSWGFAAIFETETSVPWELVKAATVAGTAITLRDALPNASMSVDVRFTSVLSGQLTRNEVVRNDGSGGTAPNIYYPAYFCDVSDAIRQLFSDITAAGVIPYYQRKS